MINAADDRKFVDQFAKCGATKDTSKMKEFFRHFDRNNDGQLDLNEFKTLMKALVDTDSEQALLDGVKRVFAKLDKNGDKHIDSEEFKHAWFSWLPRVLDPVFALIVVDVQNDFITGTLALKDCPAGEDGAEVVPIVNRMAVEPAISLVVYTLDWHPANHISFWENRENFKLAAQSSTMMDWFLVDKSAIRKQTSDVSTLKALDKVFYSTDFGDMENTLWPAHCIQNSTGAELSDKLRIPKDSIKVYKGQNVQLDSYSAFFDNGKIEKTTLDDELRKRNVTHVLTCGLATDVCVNFTSMDGLDLGYRVALVEDSARGVNKDSIVAFKAKLVARGGVITNSSDVQHLASAKYRPLEWALLD